MQMKHLNDLQVTECERAFRDFFNTTSGRQVGRLVTAERSLGPQGQVTETITDIGTVFRQVIRDLYLQPEPKLIGEP